MFFQRLAFVLLMLSLLTLELPARKLPAFFFKKKGFLMSFKNSLYFRIRLEDISELHVISHSIYGTYTYIQYLVPFLGFLSLPCNYTGTLMLYVQMFSVKGLSTVSFLHQSKGYECLLCVSFKTAVFWIGLKFLAPFIKLCTLRRNCDREYFKIHLLYGPTDQRNACIWGMG